MPTHPRQRSAARSLIFAATLAAILPQTHAACPLFASAGTSPLGSAIGSLAAGDLDGDGDDDLVYANAFAGLFGGPGSLLVRLNDGSGAFHQSFTLSTASRNSWVRAADADADGDLDLATDVVEVFINATVPPPLEHPGCSPADTATPEGEVNVFDLIVYLGWYSLGDPLLGQGDPTMVRVDINQDCSLDSDDVVFYVQSAVAGCP